MSLTIINPSINKSLNPKCSGEKAIPTLEDINEIAIYEITGYLRLTLEPNKARVVIDTLN